MCLYNNGDKWKLEKGSKHGVLWQKQELTVLAPNRNKLEETVFTIMAPNEQKQGILEAWLEPGISSGGAI